MTAHEWDDLLHDMQAELLEPDGRRDCRQKLAERLADLEQRLVNVECTAKSAANTVSCLANGMQPD